MEQLKIDAAIFEALEDRWQKVAMIMARVGKRIPALSDEDGFDAIGERIRWLVESGRVEGAGDLNRPRYCEVRWARALEN